MRWDAFPFAGTPVELLLLECRLTELYDHVDGFIIVEADVDHQNKPKPWRFLDEADRYEQWSDKITYVQASGLPDSPHLENPWAREHAQREWIAQGLEDVGAEDDDVVFQSDLDEIPSRLAVRNVRPQRNEMVSLHQRGHFWAIDWLYPLDHGWFGTVAARWGCIKSLADHRASGPFAAMRDSRNMNKKVPGGGWHFSWLGGPEAAERKVGSFCHPEVVDRLEKHGFDYYRETGIHIDGVPMKPVDVDRTWPKWMQDRDNVPSNWYRPR